MSKTIKSTAPIVRRPVDKGIHVSLADILIAHIVVFGAKMPSDLPFVTAADRIKEARPADWINLMRLVMTTRELNPGKTYEELAAIVKAA